MKGPFFGSARLALLTALSLAIVACGGGDGGGPPVPKTVKITADTTPLLVEDSLQLSATVTLSNGQPAVGQTISWSSSNASIVSVTGTGLLIAHQIGEAQISASAAGITGGQKFTVYAGKPKEVVKVAGTGAITVTSTEAQIAAGTITVTRAATAPALKAGDVLVGTDKGTYLQKVVTASGTGTTQTLTTTAATLDEGLEDGDVEVSENVNIAALLRQAFLTAGATGGSGVNGSTWAEGVTLGRDGRLVLNSVPFNLTSRAQIGPFSANGSLSGNVAIKFGSAVRAGTEAFEFKLKIKNGKFKRMRAVTTMGVEFDGTATMEFAGSVTSLVMFPSYEREIVSIRFYNSCVFVGVFPVCIQGNYKIIVYAQPFANVLGTMTSSVAVSRGITAGVDFQDGQWSTVSIPSGSSSFTMPERSFGGNVGLQIGVKPQIEFLLYGAAGPYTGVDYNARGEVGVENNGYNWYAEATAGVGLFVGARAQVLGKTLADFSNTLEVGGRVNIVPKRTGAAATVTLSPSPVTVAVGASQTLTPTVRSMVGNHLLPTSGFTCTSSNTAIATSNNCVVTGVAIGSATVTARSNSVAAVSATVPVTVQSAVPLGTAVPVPNPIEAVHTYGVSSCPQNVGLIRVRNTHNAAVNVALTDDTNLMQVSGAATVTMAAGAEQDFPVVFTCAGATSFTEDMTVRFTSGNRVETIRIPIKVTVVGGPPSYP